MNCPLCNDDVGDTHNNLRYHFFKFHDMDFADNAEMKRRLQAVGIDIPEEQQQFQKWHNPLQTINS